MILQRCHTRTATFPHPEAPAWNLVKRRVPRIRIGVVPLRKDTQRVRLTNRGIRVHGTGDHPQRLGPRHTPRPTPIPVALDSRGLGEWNE